MFQFVYTMCKFLYLFVLQFLYRCIFNISDIVNKYYTILYIYTYLITHTHTHVYIYIYIYTYAFCYIIVDIRLHCVCINSSLYQEEVLSPIRTQHLELRYDPFKSLHREPLISISYRVSQKKCNELHFPRLQGK